MTFIVCISCPSMLTLSQSVGEYFRTLIEIGIHLVVCISGHTYTALLFEKKGECARVVVSECLLELLLATQGKDSPLGSSTVSL